MSSVASETHTVLPPRPHWPSPRSHAEAEAREPATPFAELLDSAAPERPPAPRQARAERPERADRPKPARDRAHNDNDDAKAKATRGKAAAGDDAKNAEDTKDAGGSTKAEDGEPAAAAEAAGQSKPAADQKAALDAMFIDAATPAVVTAPAQPLALAAVTIEADALEALQAAGGVAPDTAAKPGQAPADKSADAAAKAAASAGPQAAVPEIESGKDGQARGSGDKAGGEFRRVVADLLTKPEMAAPAQSASDAGGAVKAGAEAMQNLGLAAPANAGNPASAAANAPASSQVQAQAAAVPLSGLAVEITAQARAGNNHFAIRLDPPELGRIDVKLDIDRDGNVSTRLVVDRADTLDLLKRDASSLERALQQSGLKTSDNALEFSLRQQGFAQDDAAPKAGAQLVIPDDDPAPLEAMRQQGYGRLLGFGGGLDIRV